MMDYSSGNKRAWEYNAYEFWLKEEGPPSKKAEKIIENPAAMLKKCAGSGSDRIRYLTG